MAKCSSIKKKQEKTSPGNWQCASVLLHEFDGLHESLHSFSSLCYFASLARLRTRVREAVGKTDMKICKAPNKTQTHLFTWEWSSKVGPQKSRWNCCGNTWTREFEDVKHAEGGLIHCEAKASVPSFQAQVASASYMLLIFPPKVPHWTRILIVIFNSGGASVCESQQQQSTSRKRQCSPVFTAARKTLDPSITGLKVSSHGRWSRKCGLCGTSKDLLWVFTHAFRLKKGECLVVLIFWQVTETRTGPLGCSNYDNLDTVSSVLVHSPENKVQLQGKTVTVIWILLIVLHVRQVILWKVSFFSHSISSNPPIHFLPLPPLLYQGCRSSSPATCRASSYRRLLTTLAASPKASLSARMGTAGASAAWTFRSATVRTQTWTLWRKTCFASERPGGWPTRSLRNQVSRGTGILEGLHENC